MYKSKQVWFVKRYVQDYALTIISISSSKFMQQNIELGGQGRYLFILFQQVCLRLYVKTWCCFETSFREIEIDRDKKRDRDREIERDLDFQSKPSQYLMFRLKIKKLRTKGYNPRGNGVTKKTS